MSSTNKTANLKLHSWVRTDPVVCEDFNDNFTKLDEAVGSLSATRGNCEIYSGTYTGTGTKTLTLTFPKLPLYLIIQPANDNFQTYAGFVLHGVNFLKHGTNTNYNIMYVSGTTITFQESSNNSNAVTTLNVADKDYCYIAFAPAG